MIEYQEIGIQINIKILLINNSNLHKIKHDWIVLNINQQSDKII